MAKLTSGDKAPGFRLQDQHGKNIQLSDFTGRRMLLYFFPKANTAG
jgi:peroxiredoxin Q/BCP